MGPTVINDVPKRLFIAGAWQDAESGRTLAVDDPATGEQLCRVADASPSDGMRDPAPRPQRGMDGFLEYKYIAIPTGK